MSDYDLLGRIIATAKEMHQVPLQGTVGTYTSCCWESLDEWKRRMLIDLATWHLSEVNKIDKLNK